MQVTRETRSIVDQALMRAKARYSLLDQEGVSDASLIGLTQAACRTPAAIGFGTEGAAYKFVEDPHTGHSTLVSVSHTEQLEAKKAFVSKARGQSAAAVPPPSVRTAGMTTTQNATLLGTSQSVAARAAASQQAVATEHAAASRLVAASGKSAAAQLRRPQGVNKDEPTSFKVVHTCPIHGNLAQTVHHQDDTRKEEESVSLPQPAAVSRPHLYAPSVSHAAHPTSSSQSHTACVSVKARGVANHHETQRLTAGEEALSRMDQQGGEVLRFDDDSQHAKKLEISPQRSHVTLDPKIDLEDPQIRQQIVDAAMREQMYVVAAQGSGKHQRDAALSFHVSALSEVKRPLATGLEDDDDRSPPSGRENHRSQERQQEHHHHRYADPSAGQQVVAADHRHHAVVARAEEEEGNSEHCPVCCTCTCHQEFEEEVAETVANSAARLPKPQQRPPVPSSGSTQPRRRKLLQKSASSAEHHHCVNIVPVPHVDTTTNFTHAEATSTTARSAVLSKRVHSSSAGSEMRAQDARAETAEQAVRPLEQDPVPSAGSVEAAMAQAVRQEEEEEDALETMQQEQNVATVRRNQASTAAAADLVQSPPSPKDDMAEDRSKAQIVAIKAAEAAAAADCEDCGGRKLLDTMTLVKMRDRNLSVEERNALFSTATAAFGAVSQRHRRLHRSAMATDYPNVCLPSNTRHVHRLQTIDEVMGTISEMRTSIESLSSRHHRPANAVAQTQLLLTQPRGVSGHDAHRLIRHTSATRRTQAAHVEERERRLAVHAVAQGGSPRRARSAAGSRSYSSRAHRQSHQVLACPMCNKC